MTDALDDRQAHWADSAPPVDLVVRCGGNEHRLVWERGAVRMLDHPEPDAERAMVALGGAEPPCLALLGLWELAIADGGFLEEWVDDANLSPVRLSWLGMALERLRNEGFHEFLRAIPSARAEPMGRFLHRFPRPWLDRAAAAVSESIVDGEGVVCDHAYQLVCNAAAQRVRRAFVASVGGPSSSGLSLGAAALVPLAVEVRAGAPTIGGRLSGPDRGVTIGIDDRWLHAVWAACAAVIDGQLVLELDGAGAATVVSWKAGEPATETRVARFDGVAWSLEH